MTGIGNRFNNILHDEPCIELSRFLNKTKKSNRYKQ